MATRIGLYVSTPNKDVLKSVDQSIGFSADLNLIKVKQEKFAMNGETLNFDHGLNYFPILLPFGYNTSLTDGRALGFVYATVWSSQTVAYTFLAFNPGVQ